MRTKLGRSHFTKPVVSFEGDSARGSKGPPTELATLAIATDDDFAGAGIEALLQASGHKVVARCPDSEVGTTATCPFAVSNARQLTRKAPVGENSSGCGHGVTPSLPQGESRKHV